MYQYVNEFIFSFFKVAMNNAEVSCEYCKSLKSNIEVRLKSNSKVMKQIWNCAYKIVRTIVYAQLQCLCNSSLCKNKIQFEMMINTPIKTDFVLRYGNFFWGFCYYTIVIKMWFPKVTHCLIIDILFDCRRKCRDHLVKVLTKVKPNYRL